MIGFDSPLHLPPAAVNAATALSGAVANSPSAETAGREFESIFWSMLIKTMRTSVSGEGLFAGDKSDTFGGMFDLFMSQHLADANSLGIANLVQPDSTGAGPHNQGDR